MGKYSFELLSLQTDEWLIEMRCLDMIGCYSVLKKRGLGYISMVESMPSLHKNLGSIPSVAEMNK